MKKFWSSIVFSAAVAILVVMAHAFPFKAQVGPGGGGVGGGGGGTGGSSFPVTTSVDVASGGTITIDSGGTLTCAAGSTCPGGGGLSGITATGSVNAMVATFSPALTSQAAFTTVEVLPNLANTIAAPTLTANSLAAQTITVCGTQALQAGDYITTKPAFFISDGTYWQLQNPQRTRCGDFPYALNVSTGSATVTPVNGFFQTFTVSQATTIAFTQPLTGKVTVQLQITQATGTHYAITWTSVRWPSGQAPVLTAVDAAVDYVTCVLDGTHVDCTGAGAQAFQ